MERTLLQDLILYAEDLNYAKIPETQNYYCVAIIKI